MLPRNVAHAWAAKSAPEIRELGGRDGSVLVVPVGSVEQHGNHLPVSTDALLAEAVSHLGAGRVADELPILVAPTVWAGNSPHHVSLGGTITAGVDHLLDALADVARAGVENDFDALLFLNGHGGNAAAVSNAVSVAGNEHPETEVTGLTYFLLAEQFVDEFRESDVGGMAHGGEFETSLMLHLHPDLVDMENADAEYLDEPYELGTKDLLDGGTLSAYRPFEEYSPSGAIGDPELASAEKGELVFERLGDELAPVLREIHKQAGRE